MRVSRRQERRRAQRFSNSTSVRLLVGGAREGAGALLDVSELGAAIVTQIGVDVGDEVVFYTEGFGRLAGRVVRVFSGGFAMEFALTEIQRGSIRERIAALVTGKPYLRLSEKRGYARKAYNLEATARTSEEGEFSCILHDISKTGCLIRADTVPNIGADISIGSLRGKVIRREENSFAVQFY